MESICLKAIEIKDNTHIFKTIMNQRLQSRFTDTRVRRLDTVHKNETKRKRKLKVIT